MGKEQINAMRLLMGHGHYIRIDEAGRITYGFSDAFESPQEDDILLREDAGRQFRLYDDGEENPALYSLRGIPLYRYADGEIVQRTAQAVQSEEEALPLPVLTPAQPSVLQKKE